MRRQRCFVIIPFRNDFTDVFEDICSVVEELGLECRRGDHHKRPGVVMAQIERDIRGADLIIADVSDGNQNVLYETGIAHCTLGPERTILLTRNPQELPYDLRAQRYLGYVASSTGREPFRRELRQWIQNALEYFPEEEGAVIGPQDRTREIIERCRLLGEVWKDPANPSPRIIRTIAGLSSLAISEHELMKEPAPPSEELRLYPELLQRERDHLLDLLDQGARMQMILHPPVKYEPKRGWIRLALRYRRMIRLLQGGSDSADTERQRQDRLVRERCSTAFVQVTEPNTLILGDRIGFEVFRRAEVRGFEGTYWTTKRSQVDDLIRTFDHKFAAAGGVWADGPVDQTAAIAQLQAACEEFRQNVGSDWDESVFDDLP